MNDSEVFKRGLCAECGKKIVSRWCDYHIKYTNDKIFVRGSSKESYEFAKANSGRKNETCDLPICEWCAKEIGHDIHMCSYHYEIYLRAKELPTKKMRDRRKKEHVKIMTGD